MYLVEIIFWIFLRLVYMVEYSLVMLGSGSELQLPLCREISEDKQPLQSLYASVTILFFTFNAVVSESQQALCQVILPNFRLMQVFSRQQKEKGKDCIFYGYIHMYIVIFIYFTASGLSCSMWGARTLQLWQAGLVALKNVGSYWFPNQELNMQLLHGKADSQPRDHQEVPRKEFLLLLTRIIGRQD